MATFGKGFDGQNFLHEVKLLQPSAIGAVQPYAVRKKPVWWSQRTKRGLQLAPLALLLLHDQGYKGWCHDGHGTSYNPSGTSCGVTLGSDGRCGRWLQKLTSCKKFCPSKPFPKVAICLGEMGGRLGPTPLPIYRLVHPTIPHQPIPLTRVGGGSIAFVRS